MTTMIAALAATLLLGLSTADAQTNYTCADVKQHSCSVLRFHAWWHNISRADQRRIALKCGVSHCLR